MSAGFGAFEIARSGMHVNERGLLQQDTIYQM